MNFNLPGNWLRRSAAGMAMTLARNEFVSRNAPSVYHKMQARADLEQIINASTSFSDVAKRVYQYTKQSMPLSFILENQPFCGLELSVKPPVLIPRLETEHWVQDIIATLDLSNKLMLEVGTGSGCIAIAIAKAFPTAKVVALDVSRSVVQLASTNAKRCGAGNIGFVHGSFEDYNPEFRFDLVVSNPPYIPATRRLPRSVRLYEGRTALYSGADGLGLIKTLISRAPSMTLGQSGLPFLILEFDSPQKPEIQAMWPNTEFKKDQFGRDRVAWLRN